MKKRPQPLQMLDEELVQKLREWATNKKDWYGSALLLTAAERLEVKSGNEIS